MPRQRRCGGHVPRCKDVIKKRLIGGRDLVQLYQSCPCIAAERIRLGRPVEKARSGREGLEAVLGRLVIIVHRLQVV